MEWIKGNTPKINGRYFVTELVGNTRHVDPTGYIFQDGKWYFKDACDEDLVECFRNGRNSNILAYAPFVSLEPFQG